jgi:hypothetical protein
LQGRTGGRSVVFSGQFTFVVVASCWSSSGDVELSMLLLPHTRTHPSTLSISFSLTIPYHSFNILWEWLEIEKHKNIFNCNDGYKLSYL